MNRSVQIKHEIIASSYKYSCDIFFLINDILVNFAKKNLQRRSQKDHCDKNKRILNETVSDIVSALHKYTDLPYSCQGRTSNFQLSIVCRLTVGGIAYDMNIEFVFLSSFPVCLDQNQIDSLENRFIEIRQQLKNYFSEIKAQIPMMYSRLLYNGIINKKEEEQKEGTNGAHKLNIGYNVIGSSEFITNMLEHLGDRDDSDKTDAGNDIAISADIPEQFSSNSITFGVGSLKPNLFLKAIFDDIDVTWKASKKNSYSVTDKDGSVKSENSIIYVKSYVSCYPKFTINCALVKSEKY